VKRLLALSADRVREVDAACALNVMSRYGRSSSSGWPEWGWGWLFAALDEGVGDAGEKEDGKDGGVLPWGANSGFDQPPEVDDGGYSGDVDEAVEALPVFAPHGSQDEGGRCDCKGQQDGPGEEAYLDEAALAEIIENSRPDELPLGDELAGVAGAETGEGCGYVVAGEEEDVCR